MVHEYRGNAALRRLIARARNQRGAKTRELELANLEPESETLVPTRFMNSGDRLAVVSVAGWCAWHPLDKSRVFEHAAPEAIECSSEALMVLASGCRSETRSYRSNWMPHFTVEYTDNNKPTAGIAGLLTRVNPRFIVQDGVLPTSRIRWGAVELRDYRIAHGTADNAFVHGTLRAGYSDPVKRRVCDELFAVIKDHFAARFAKRKLVLPLDLIEGNETFSYKHNNIHARFKQR